MAADDRLTTVDDAIHLIRGQRVMLDSDLAQIYGTHLRDMISANAELARKFALERRLDAHDEQIAHLFAAIRQLLAPAPEKKRKVRFHVRETAPRYRVGKKA